MDLVIKLYNPKLKDNSLKAYLINLRKLNNNEDPKNLNFLKDFDTIIGGLSKYKESTRKNYLNTIIVSLKALKEDNKLINKYEVLRDKYQSNYNEKLQSNTMSESQSKNFVKWEDFEDMVSLLEKEILPLKKQKTGWSDSETVKYQNWLVVLLYKHFPIRNDFHDMEIISKKEYNKIKKPTTNYLVTSKPRKMFKISDYKTSDKYGTKTLVIEDKQLISAINIWLKHNTSKYFILNPAKLEQPISSNQLTRLLTGISKERLDGRSVGSTMLRHSYLTHKFGALEEEKEKAADMMGHSKEMGTGYILKEDED